MSFKKAVENANDAVRTTNGMGAYSSTGSKCLDFFSGITSESMSLFESAFIESPEYAVRIALWNRDVREGNGRRQYFRNIIQNLISNYKYSILERIYKKIPELGRWDDILPLALMDAKTEKSITLRDNVVAFIKESLLAGDSLCAKWMPLNNKNKADGAKLRNLLKLSPSEYRSLLVSLRAKGNIVEQKMCSNDWDAIDFSKVPSQAIKNYTKAFGRHTINFDKWKEALLSETPDSSVKINAGAIYPYQVLQNYDDNIVLAQWNALPNYVLNGNIFPVCDTSGSMRVFIESANVTALEISISLGLYLSDKNTGPFNGMLSIFSKDAQFVNLTGNIIQKRDQIPSIISANTNLEALFEKLLKIGLDNKVADADMPRTVVIFSDMQFDSAVSGDYASALEMIKAKYAKSGYSFPAIIFWNLAASNHGNVPAKMNENGVMLVSGFSTSILKSILDNNIDVQEFTPKALMDKVILNPRYDF